MIILNPDLVLISNEKRKFSFLLKIHSEWYLSIHY